MSSLALNGARALGGTNTASSLTVASINVHFAASCTAWGLARQLADQAFSHMASIGQLQLAVAAIPSCLTQRAIRSCRSVGDADRDAATWRVEAESRNLGTSKGEAPSSAVVENIALVQIWPYLDGARCARAISIARSRTFHALVGCSDTTVPRLTMAQIQSLSDITGPRNQIRVVVGTKVPRRARVDAHRLYSLS